jgi:hypothetical protein
MSGMPTVAIVDGILILFYWNDHDPPHFHADGAGFRARIAIEDAAMIDVVGRLSSATRRRLIEWTQAHRPALAENWDLARRGQPLKRIG